MPHNQIRKLRRRLASSGYLLRKATPRDIPSLGQFYLIDADTNCVVCHDVDLLQLADE
jgi:hypothetical protein